MPKTGKDARSERNRLKAHYEQKFSARLKEKDGTIRALLDENEKLRQAVKDLQGRVEAEQAASRKLEELVKTLQGMTGFSDEELQKVKDDIDLRRDASKHAGEIKAALNALCGGDTYGTAGLLPDVLMHVLCDMKARSTKPTEEKT